MKVESTGSYSDAHKYVADLVPKFLQHCYIKRQQATSYKELHSLVLSDDFPKDVALIQVDFSENYTCVHQDEVQSAHWHQSQVSLFTAAAYHSGVIHPVVIASDILDHTKETVVCYVSHLLDEIPSSIRKVEMWSDGPSSQFKNRFIAAALDVLETKYNIKIKWNFFATSHGKGPVDGIGGTLKRVVFEQVKRRVCQVTDAASFVEAAKRSGTSINVLHLTESHITERNDTLNLKRTWENAPKLSGITKFHCLVTANRNPEGFVLSRDSLESERSRDANSTINKQ